MRNIKEIREKRNITQSELAHAIGVKQEAISSYEHGRTTFSVDVLIKLADYFNTSTDYLLERTDDESPIKNVNFNQLNNLSYRLINNFIMLNDDKKQEVIWYSEAIRKREK